VPLVPHIFYFEMRGRTYGIPIYNRRPAVPALARHSRRFESCHSDQNRGVPSGGLLIFHRKAIANLRHPFSNRRPAMPALARHGRRFESRHSDHNGTTGLIESVVSLLLSKPVDFQWFSDRPQSSSPFRSSFRSGLFAILNDIIRFSPR